MKTLTPFPSDPWLPVWRCSINRGVLVLGHAVLHLSRPVLSITVKSRQANLDIGVVPGERSQQFTVALGQFRCFRPLGLILLFERGEIPVLLLPCLGYLSLHFRREGGCPFGHLRLCRGRVI